MTTEEMERRISPDLLDLDCAPTPHPDFRLQITLGDPPNPLPGNPDSSEVPQTPSSLWTASARPPRVSRKVLQISFAGRLVTFCEPQSPRILLRIPSKRRRACGVKPADPGVLRQNSRILQKKRGCTRQNVCILRQTYRISRQTGRVELQSPWVLQHSPWVLRLTKWGPASDPDDLQQICPGLQLERLTPPLAAPPRTSPRPLRGSPPGSPRRSPRRSPWRSRGPGPCGRRGRGALRDGR